MSGVRFSRAALKDAQAAELNEASNSAAAAEAAGSAPGHQLACRIDDCVQRSGRESSRAKVGQQHKEGGRAST